MLFFSGQKDNAIAMFWKFNEYTFRSELKCHECLMIIFDFLPWNVTSLIRSLVVEFVPHCMLMNRKAFLSALEF